MYSVVCKEALFPWKQLMMKNNVDWLQFYIYKVRSLILSASIDKKHEFQKNSGKLTCNYSNIF